jgi:ZIP family zinc transporter
MSDLVMILAITVPAALASPLGGLISLWRPLTSLLLSITVGFAGGVLLATFAFEMLPKALELSSLPLAVAGFGVGFVLVYALDLFINRGRLAGKEADQRKQVRRFHLRHPPRGSETAVLAGGTSAEELIEGATIGVGVAIDPSLGMIVAIAIFVDNVSEALSIGELLRAEQGEKKSKPWTRILGWTSLIGISLLSSALLGWWLLRGMPRAGLGTMFAVGAGGMFYLTVTDLLPESAEHHYQQSAAMATALGFLTIFVLSELM